MQIQVFGVEPDAVQLTWQRLPALQAVVEVGDRRVQVDATPPHWYPAGSPRTGGPGAVVVDGLEPGTDYDITLSIESRPRSLVGAVRTAPPPPGPALARFATVSDCHIGERRFGAIVPMPDPARTDPGADPYPLRALRAAIREIGEWQAECIIARGDLTRHGRDGEAGSAATALNALGLPVHAVLGNHDMAGRDDVGAVLAEASVAVGLAGRPQAVDLPGVRVVLGHTPVAGLHGGRLADQDLGRLMELTSEAPGPAVLVLHHPPRSRRLPTYYPPSLCRADSRRLVEQLREANPAVLVLSGHTHRTRRYDVGGVAVSEVGSTKDYPGQWAGYTVYEGAIAQTVRRISAPDVIAWTEISGRALGGLWRHWSPGRLADRSWVHEWPSTGGVG